ncbi:zinc ribbon domain-containing protein [Massilimicrobiota timonensis]|uniref:Zinc ribbon domain-containing protein n=1 Tax=Massilimicrobiota timonensis TaxID=1776392 RepID=A0ABT7UGX9_9FIRM|nr:zinc ribbon domain-containing protein [Massilimicrobiota timonensis]MDM8195397.1 zinc ribbon domain-containing protein [Massilimicrobiota timonensis]
MKKLLKTLSLLLAVFLLTGCMKMTINLEVNADKSVNTSMDFLMEESALTASQMTKEEFVEQMKEQMLSSEETKNVKVTSIEETINASNWVGVRMEGLASTADEMGVNITEETIDGKDCIVLKLPMEDLSQQMDSQLLQSADYSVDKMKALGLEMVINVKMPGKATSNVGTVDGQNVKIDLLELVSQSHATNEIVISSPKSAGMDMTFVFIGIGALVIIGIVVFVLKNKKKTKQTLIEDNIDSQLDESVESTPDTQTETIQQEQIIEQDQKQPQDHTDENNG